MGVITGETAYRPKPKNFHRVTLLCSTNVPPPQKKKNKKIHKIVIRPVEFIAASTPRLFILMLVYGPNVTNTNPEWSTQFCDYIC